jgi:transcriptional regulator with GAF, ATPase, and Fis domain
MAKASEPLTPNAQLRAQLGAFNEATLTITAELALERVLQRIAHLARELVNARYAALAIPDGEGGVGEFHTSGMDEAQVAQMEHLPRGLGLLGALLNSNKPIRVPRIADDSRSVGFCKNHPPMTSFLGVPIVSKGALLGTLHHRQDRRT